MNNKLIIGIVLVIVVIAGVYFLMQKQYKPNQQPSQQPVQEQNKVNANTITIQNFAFSPDSLTVKQGTKVTWINNDSTTHSIKSDSFNSTNLSTGDKFEFTFTDKGSFDYSCGIHPSMKGKVIVE